MAKVMPKELHFLNPHVQQITNEKRMAAIESRLPEAPSVAGPSRSGLTDDASNEQANRALRQRRRPRIQTVFAGETGSLGGQTDKLGLTGRI